MKRIVVTGAAGNIGRALRPRIHHLTDDWVLSDIAPSLDCGPGESYAPCDLGDFEAVRGLVKGADIVLHFGGIPYEAPFEDILHANIRGTYNLYEAARQEGVRRILFASTNHVVGFYPQTEQVDTAMPMRPDGLYAASKCYGEALARLYFDKFGIETAMVRIGACWEKPTTVRMLSLWLSHDDLARLVERVVRIPVLGCPVIFGASANEAGWWDNSAVRYLGWTPQDTSEPFRAECEAAEVASPAPDADRIWQGGRFTDDPIYPARA